MIEDESEVFEITDFTTASEWERFIAKLEEIIHEWKLTSPGPRIALTKGELTSAQWQEKCDSLSFADFKFIITRHFLKKEEPGGGGGGDGAQDEQQEAGLGAAPTESREESPSDANEEGGLPIVWQDMMSVENDFPSRAHCLCRWYGLRDFVTLAPASDMEDIMSESRANLLLSSVAVALHTTACQVPVFVQVHQKWRRLYMGQCECPGFRTCFEMVHLKHIPHQYSHLAGLLDVFKSKLACPVSPLPPVSVAVRFTYVLQDWTHYSWPQQPPDIDSLSADEVGVTEFGELPFGSCEDPVNELHLSTTWPSLSEEMIVDNDVYSELHLSTTWPSLSEEMIVDNDVYSDLDPAQAPHWCVRVRVAEDPQCLMGDYLLEFVKLCRRKESTDQLLGKSLLDSDDPETVMSQAFHRLTEPVPLTLPSIGTVVTRATSRLQMKSEEAPIPEDLLGEILLFLFPDAKSDSQKFGKGKASIPCTPARDDNPLEATLEGVANMLHSESQTDLESQFKEMFKQFKSAPPDSITCHLAVCMCIINHSHGGLRAVAHLWQEFVLEMRYRWENNYTIPDLEAGSPNMGCSLLHQKLQMLNCCIERKKALISERGGRTSPTNSNGSGDQDRGRTDSHLSMSSDDEEFFECEDAEAETVPPATEKKTASEASGIAKNHCENQTLSKDRLLGVRSSPQTNQSDGRDAPTGRRSDSRKTLSMTESEMSLDLAFTDSWDHQPEGRFKPCDDLKLLNIHEPMYIPLTQEPAPMTEDTLDEHAEVLAKLGTSAEGASLRARMQSACLLSDMESFKAANPGCCLGDFVRWYSPRDWVEEEALAEDGTIAKKGQLSQRMQIPGNMWVEVWQSAMAVPARRQRRLFDDTKEAEKVLHWLAAMRPADVALRLMPMLVHAAITKLMEQEVSQLPMLKKLLNQISNKATKAMRAPQMEKKRFEDLVRQLTMAEVVVTRAQSLLTKFNQEKQDLELSQLDMQEFVSTLLDQPEVNIIGAARSPIGTIIHRLFATAQKSAYLLPEEDMMEDEGDKSSRAAQDFPSPVGKEYILRTTVARPAPWSRPSPQRLFCVLMKDDFRLIGSFSSDTTFQ